MTTRKLTAKTFARLSIKNMTHAEFLTAHWEWLEGHTFLAPLLTAYQGQEINAENCIAACREALLMHDIRAQIIKAEESMKKSISRVDEAKYTVTIYVKWFDISTNKWEMKVGTTTHRSVVEDENGKEQIIEEEKDMVYSARLFQNAERLATLRLARREDAIFAEIANNFDKKVITTMTRDQGLGLMYPHAKHPFMKRAPSQESKPFRNYPRAHNDRVSFSRG